MRKISYGHEIWPGAVPLHRKNTILWDRSGLVNKNRSPVRSMDTACEAFGLTDISGLGTCVSAPRTADGVSFAESRIVWADETGDRPKESSLPFHLPVTPVISYFFFGVDRLDADFFDEAFPE